MSKWPHRQQLGGFLSPVSMTYVLALSWTSLCLGRRSLSLLSCSLLAPRNPPLAPLLPDCPKVRQKPPVTLNFFTVLASNEHFITLRRCGRRQSITNPPPLDPDLLWGADTGPGTGCVGTQPSKDAPTCEAPCDKIIVQTT